MPSEITTRSASGAIRVAPRSAYEQAHEGTGGRTRLLPQVRRGTSRSRNAGPRRITADPGQNAGYAGDADGPQVQRVLRYRGQDFRGGGSGEIHRRLPAIRPAGERAGARGSAVHQQTIRTDSSPRMVRQDGRSAERSGVVPVHGLRKAEGSYRNLQRYHRSVPANQGTPQTDGSAAAEERTSPRIGPRQQRHTARG